VPEHAYDPEKLRIDRRAWERAEKTRSARCAVATIARTRSIAMTAKYGASVAGGVSGSDASVLAGGFHLHE